MSDEKAILTITFIKYKFQFGLLIKKSNPSDAVTKIKKLFRLIGFETAKKIFQINLADNGAEFSYFNQIEVDDSGQFICRTFFTNPYKATDKAETILAGSMLPIIMPKAVPDAQHGTANKKAP